MITDQEAKNITRGEELAYELKVDQVMTRNPKCATTEMVMRDVLDLFRETHVSGAPVLENDHLAGVVSMEDLIHCLVKGDLDSITRNYMTFNPLTIQETDPLIEAVKNFVNTRLGRFPVINSSGNLVGIITKGDVTRGLLKALEKDIHEEEIRTYRARHLFEDIISDQTSLILRYNIKGRDFTRGGAASSHIKRALMRLGASPQIARRVGIAVYEAEMNLIIHTNNGGIVRTEIEPTKISIDVIDDGPGIPDVEIAMKPGYSTATDEIRELGFGAGMGLVNISRCVDFMKLDSDLDMGTHLKLQIFLESQETVGEGYSQTKENKV